MQKRGPIGLIISLAVVVLVLLIGIGVYFYLDNDKISCEGGKYSSNLGACVYKFPQLKPDLIVKCPEGFGFNKSTQVCEMTPEVVRVCGQGIYNNETGMCEVELDTQYTCEDGKIQEIAGELVCVVDLDNVVVDDWDEDGGIDYEDSPFGLFVPKNYSDNSVDAEAVIDLDSHWIAVMTGSYNSYQVFDDSVVIFPSVVINKNIISGESGFIKPSEFHNYIANLLNFYSGTDYWGLVSESDGENTGIPPQRLAIYTRLSYQAIKGIDSEIKFISSGTEGQPDSYYDVPYNPETKEGYYNAFFEELDYIESVEQNITNNGGTYLDYYDGRYNQYDYSNEDLIVIFSPDSYSKYMDGHQFSKFFVELGGGKGIRQKWEELFIPMSSLFEKFGYSDTELWLTQTGLQSASFSWTEWEWEAPNVDNGFSESKQAQSVVQIYSSLLKDGLEKIFWVNTYEMTWTNNPDHYFSKIGLKYNGLKNQRVGSDMDDLGYGVKKLSYYSYKLMVDKLEGSDWDNIIETEVVSNVYLYKFMKDGEPIYVVWWDYWEESGATSKTVSLSDLGISGSVTITEAVPHFENGLILQNSGESYPGFFDTETSSTSITLGESPVYLE